MNAYDILDAIGAIDDRMIEDAERAPSRTKRRAAWKIALIAAAAVLLCGFAAYEAGLFDPWIETPSSDPIEVVRSAVEGQLKKDYTLSLEIEEIAVDDAETARAIERYAGSELASERGWVVDEENFVAVYARYRVEYDHTKTFIDDGMTEQYFYLIRDPHSGEWSIADNSAPNT